MVVHARIRCCVKYQDEVAFSIEHEAKKLVLGQIRMQTLNRNTLDQFVLGKEYYVDFTPVEDS